ncbi:hypothetical protein QGN29_13960 [Temperatibacter marinus]|uniref:VWFA domain-containing protein n=1 Tax=Temperatibacter marinus TaxID=1456591 RepID=A0AA52EFD4_9PROT|nr:hypothetical protein [Temperatibacter marinus]WND02653.1 hypothetical protein QGN29_13960 [Temperatibacter marinus]
MPFKCPKLLDFIKNEEGGLSPLIAGSMVMLIGVSGIVVDSARMFYAKNIMQKSLDAAGLAAGHSMHSENMEPSAQEFFNSNFNENLTYASSAQISVTISDDNKLINLTATASIDATFMKLFGFNTLDISAATEITRDTRGMELVLVMDNTGSMRSSSKMTAMKDAAEDLIEIVYGDNDTNSNLWAGLIPYSSMVNVGQSHVNWLNLTHQDDVNLHDKFGPTEWKGCVMARSDDEDQTDTNPTTEPFDYFFWDDDVDNNWIKDDGSFQLSEANSAQNNGRGPNLGCGPAITPLVASKTTLIEAIDEMEPWHRGGTTSNLGLVWGWRALSPNWAGLWGGDSPAFLPLPYDTPFMDKVVVLLTDGNNQFYDWKSHSPDGGVGPFGSDKTGYGRLHDLGVTSLSDGQDLLDDGLAATCEIMKNEGIIIYTITFGNSPNSQTQDLYRNCASNSSFYFHAPGNGDLATVFESIGKQLSNLRLSN